MREGCDDRKAIGRHLHFPLLFRMFSEGFTELSAEMYFRRIKILKAHFETFEVKCESPPYQSLI